MKKPKYTKPPVYLAACIFAPANFAFSQNSVGLKGGVFDERGAAIAGATVALEDDKGVKITTVTGLTLTAEVYNDAESHEFQRI